MKIFEKCSSRLFLLLVIAGVTSCDSPNEQKIVTSSNALNKVRNTNIPPYLNAVTIWQKSKDSPYNYYFKELEKINEFYSRRRGYIDETTANTQPENWIIEIQNKPDSEEIIRVYYRMDGLPSLNVSVKDITPMLDYVTMFDINASAVFHRNFNTTFHYTPNGPDSNLYINEAKNIIIGIDHNLDIVREDKKTAKDAYIQASIMPYK